MSVFGGNQIRPNIHINDIVNVFFHFLQNPEIKSGAYNAGSEKYQNFRYCKKSKHGNNARIILLNLMIIGHTDKTLRNC